MAFTIDRNEASLRLAVSTRTIDRLVALGRIQTKRIGKKIWLEEDDVESIRASDTSRHIEESVTQTESEPRVDRVYEHEIIHPDEKRVAPLEHGATMVAYSQLYVDAQTIISAKDETIQDLSYRLGKTENELRNSVPLLDYRLSTNLIETTESQKNELAKSLTEKISHLEREVEKRNMGIVGLSLLFLFVLAFAGVFFLYMYRF